MASYGVYSTLIFDESPQLKPLYLASKSPRRAEILQNLGLAFSVITPDIDESVKLHEPPHEYVLRLCAEKAQAGIQLLGDKIASESIILAADTTVCVDDDILGKPESIEHAVKMLQSLEGRSHVVHTGVAVAFNGQIKTVISTTRVWMKSLTDEDIEAYVATGEPMDKAGSYGIQGLGGAFVTRIDGSHTGVMGLPVFETMRLLNELFLSKKHD